MPPKLKARNTAVTPEFVDAMIEYYSHWLTQIGRIMTVNDHAKQQFAPAARRLIPIIRRQSPNLHGGLDYELARLRSLPFVGFSIYTHDDTTWLVGETKHITIHDWKTHDLMGELGRYWVGIPMHIVSRPDLASIHMIPIRNQRSVDRHPHHYLRDGEFSGHPLDQATGNCYGSYSGVIKGLLDEPDLPELFRQLHNHLSTYGDRPPRSMRNLDFDHTTPEEV